MRRAQSSWLVLVVFVLGAYPAVVKAAQLIYLSLHRGG